MMMEVKNIPKPKPIEALKAKRLKVMMRVVRAPSNLGDRSIGLFDFGDFKSYPFDC